jgi:ketosteroid isomerase-like protein
MLRVMQHPNGIQLGMLPMTHRAWTISAALIASVFMSTGSGRARAEDPATDIRAALEQWRLDFNGRRSANICGLFANDLRYDFRGLPEQDYSLLCNRLHRALGDTTRSFHYDLRIKEIIVSGSLAIVRLTWISTLTANGNSDTHEEPGLDVFQKQAGGRWQIIRYIAYEAGRPGD